MFILSPLAALSFLTYLGCMEAEKSCHCQNCHGHGRCNGGLFFYRVDAEFVHQPPTATVVHAGPLKLI